MGIVELYRYAPAYLGLARTLIDARDRVEDGTDDNQDRIPFRRRQTRPPLRWPRRPRPTTSTPVPPTSTPRPADRTLPLAQLLWPSGPTW